MEQNGCISRAKAFFDELGSWRDESQKQFSNIIESHNANIIEGISHLVAEVGGLQSQLSMTTKERNVLIETVKNLNDEIRQLKSITTKLQPLPESEDQAQEAEYVKDIDTLGQDEEGLEIGNKTHEELPSNYVTQKDEPNFYEMPDEDANETVQEVADEDYELSETRTVDREALWEQTDHSFQRQIYSSEENVPESAKQDIIKDYKCELCSFKTHKRSYLNRHINQQHNIAKKICQECDKAYCSNISLRLHRETVHLGIKKFKCEICPYTTNRKSNLMTHINGVHEMVKRHVCGECNYAATQKGNLVYHMKSVHNIGDNKFKCDKCPYTSASKGNLKKHTESVHKSGEKKFRCDLCPFISHLKESLKKHYKNVHLKTRAK